MSAALRWMPEPPTATPMEQAQAELRGAFIVAAQYASDCYAEAEQLADQAMALMVKVDAMRAEAERWCELAEQSATALARTKGSDGAGIR